MFCCPNEISILVASAQPVMFDGGWSKGSTPVV